MVLEWIAESFSVIDQQNSIVSRFVVMTIAILNEKIENCYIDQVQQPIQWQLFPNLTTVPIGYLPFGLHSIPIGPLPRGAVLGELPRYHEEHSSFQHFRFRIITDSFGLLAVVALAINALTGVVF